MKSSRGSHKRMYVVMKQNRMAKEQAIRAKKAAVAKKTDRELPETGKPKVWNARLVSSQYLLNNNPTSILKELRLYKNRAIGFIIREHIIKKEDWHVNTSNKQLNNLGFVLEITVIISGGLKRGESKLLT